MYPGYQESGALFQEVSEVIVGLGSLNIVIFPKIHLGGQKYHPGWPSKPADSVLSQASLHPSPIPTQPNQACHELAEIPAALGQGTFWGGDGWTETLPMSPAQIHFSVCAQPWGREVRAYKDPWDPSWLFPGNVSSSPLSPNTD